MEKQYKLPADFFDKWTALLRSGDYKQCKGQLKYDCAYCADGLAGLALGYEVGLYDIIKDNERLGYTPLVDIMGSDLVDKIWKLNDEEGLTFSEIADWLDVNVEKI